MSGDTLAGDIAGAEMRPGVIVFDVNEKLIDIGSLHPIFDRVFGSEKRMREWFSQVVMYSMTLTLA